MVFNRTSCAKDFRRGGFTLSEYLVATSIGLLVLSVALVFWAYASRTCASLLDYAELSSKSKIALDRVSQEIRNARSVQSCSATQLVLFDPDGQKTTLTWDSSGQKLTTMKGTNGSRVTLLTECTNLQFSVFQRTPVYKSFDLYTNAWQTNTAKVVQMQWTCRRKLTGDKSDVETQVSSKVVLRNQ